MVQHALHHLRWAAEISQALSVVAAGQVAMVGHKDE